MKERDLGRSVYSVAVALVLVSALPGSTKAATGDTDSFLATGFYAGTLTPQFS